MKKASITYFLTHDAGLLRHWQSAFIESSATRLTDLAALHTLTETDCVLWVDLAAQELGMWKSCIPESSLPVPTPTMTKL
jgi:hypothetical protein